MQNMKVKDDMLENQVKVNTSYQKSGQNTQEEKKPPGQSCAKLSGRFD